MDYQANIINLLLDKYEQSRHFQGTAQVNRRITLKFDKKDYPIYDIEQADVKEAIHHAALNLQKRGLITVEWMKYEEGNIMSRVFLNLEAVPEAYAFVQRKGKREILAEIRLELEKLRDEANTPWITGFCTSMLLEIEERKNIPKYLPKNQSDFHLLLAALRGIEEKGDDELLERIFSRRYLGGSKEFEKKMRSRLVTIIRRFLLDNEDIADEDVLEHIGLIKTSEDISFFGPLVVSLHGQTIDFSPFCYGASMNTEMIKNFEVAELQVARVVTIENKAAYLEYIKNFRLAPPLISAQPELKSPGLTETEQTLNTEIQPKLVRIKRTPGSQPAAAGQQTCITSPLPDTSVEQELIVYLAGFYSPVKRLFLEKIYNFVQNNRIPAAFYHWGDLDLGGFQIFAHLQKLIPELQPLHMDVSTLEENAELGDYFDEKYRKQLQKLLRQKEYAVFFPVIHAMLQMGIKLEQEALAK